jgi:hypothetical protein
VQKLILKLSAGFVFCSDKEEERSQKPEARSQKSEVRRQKPE